MTLEDVIEGIGPALCPRCLGTGRLTVVEKAASGYVTVIVSCTCEDGRKAAEEATE